MALPGIPAERPQGERIAKLLARAGIASRREVERMIAEGRVKIGGEIVTTPATILASLAGVTVDEKPVAAPERTRLFAFHKPAGLITAERDPAGRPTIYHALRNALPPGTPRLMPVGRLDFSTEGLLLLTNDGEFKRVLELPSSGIPRTYRARAFGTVSQAQLDELAEGITIAGMRYGRIIADMERRTGRNQWIVLTLTEGKNREVRRVLEHLGLEVSRLIRTHYGPFALADLPRGAAVEVPARDVDRFRAALGLGPATGAPPRASAPGKATTASARPLRAAAEKASPKAPVRRKRAADAAAQDRAAFATDRPARAGQPRSARPGLAGKPGGKPQGRPQSRPRGKGPR